MLVKKKYRYSAEFQIECLVFPDYFELELRHSAWSWKSNSLKICVTFNPRTHLIRTMEVTHLLSRRNN